MSAACIVDKYYNTLRDKILNRYFKTQENLLLTQNDIADFKDTDVIYLEKYGKYFYVNKIENFGAKALTKVELVKIWIQLNYGRKYRKKSLSWRKNFRQFYWG